VLLPSAPEGRRKDGPCTAARRPRWRGLWWWCHLRQRHRQHRRSAQTMGTLCRRTMSFPRPPACTAHKCHMGHKSHPMDSCHALHRQGRPTQNRPFQLRGAHAACSPPVALPAERDQHFTPAISCRGGRAGREEYLNYPASIRHGRRRLTDVARICGRGTRAGDWVQRKARPQSQNLAIGGANAGDGQDSTVNPLRPCSLHGHTSAHHTSRSP
jgi:hypothetical protein